jgi:dipeptidyl aminopeptidase/acylaminoacyl peptidase
VTVAVAGGARASGAIVAPRSCPPGNLGSLAFVRGGALRLLDFDGCRVRTLVRSGVRPPVALSASGRWVAFRGGYVGSGGGRVLRLPGDAIWSPRGDVLAVVTKAGGLDAGSAGGPLRLLLPQGWGASTAVFSPDGARLAVSRTAARGRVEEIWLVDVRSRSRRELFREPRRMGAPLLVEGFSPDGRRLLFWQDLDASASLLADGVPLLEIPTAGGEPRAVTRELYFRDYVTWCGGRLVYVIDHGGRTVTQGDGIAAAAAPGWGSRTILVAGRRTSWTSPACGPNGQLAVAAGPSGEDEPFGHEERSVWLVRGETARRLTATVPPRGTTDEWPSWSADGNWLLFVRTRFGGKGWPGTLFALDRAGGTLVGPIASVGATENYYGHYAWSSQLSWHRP